MNPLQGLLRSRKFLVATLDVGISLITYFVGKYVVPSIANDILFVIATLQPVALMLVISIAIEDAAAKATGVVLSVLNAMNPLQGLLRSRKFLVAVLDSAVSAVLYFTGKYAAPVAFEDIKVIVVMIQPLALSLIGAIAYEDAAAKRAGTHPNPDVE